MSKYLIGKWWNLQNKIKVANPFSYSQNLFSRSYLPLPLDYLYITVDSRYLKFQGTVWNTSRYPYFDISELAE